MDEQKRDVILERIANALERIAPPEKKIDDLNKVKVLFMNLKQV